MGSESPFDGSMEQAAGIIRTRLEDVLLAVEPRIKPLLGGDVDKAWQVIASALFTSALEVMAYVEPDQKRFIESLRTLPSKDAAKMRAFFRRVREGAFRFASEINFTDVR